VDEDGAVTPLAKGTATALAAAALFGVTAPLVRRAGLDAGAFATAALLYAGAAIGAGAPRRRAEEAAVRASDAPRIAVVALFGAALAPTLLAFGLQRAGALDASLLLNLEAIFTIALARLWYREPIGARVAAASALMLAGGALLSWRAGGARGGEALGLLAITGATLAWALDNTLTRPLADRDPRAVVFWKALIGASLSTAAALVARDRWPTLTRAGALLACGALGYGVSLRLYLQAQRVLGAARTGSLFAAGPFVGAATAYAMGERAGGASVLAAAGLFAAAAWLHARERHEHAHRHERVTHEHAHRHDDGHHEHAHADAVRGAHSHWHTHEAREHAHAHGVDVHHRHGHG
jgi:drug/metabolite transporter (DMT)-like permease